jgi:hypothetical protein
VRFSVAGEISLNLSTGQVRCHSPERYAGPDYPGDSDGECAAESRIVSVCDQFAEGLALPPERPREARGFDPFGDFDTDQRED